MTIDEFHSDFMQDLFARAGADRNFVESAFTEQMCDFLVDQAVVENYTQIDYKKTERNMRVDASLFDEESGVLTLCISEFRHSLKLESLSGTDVKRIFGKAERFLKASKSSSFYQSMEESCPAYELARDLCSQFRLITRVQFILLTNALLSKRIESIEGKEIEDCPCVYTVWDMTRLHRLESSGRSREEIVIDFTDTIETGLPCLPAFLGESATECYLLVMPGQLLAELYDMYGERLLEQNVRTFLQFRGNVNKGIRNTITNEPSMFFSYNNGISATAEEVGTSPDRSRLHIVKNLQIVNGGQTTASIFTCMKKKTDIRKVYVQVKLSVIPSEQVDEIVPRISEYANTQNKVNAADFFSNHPYHLRIEEFSRRIWAPSSDGGLRETHWFYERARGQYANAQATLTAAKKREFLSKNPRNQMFTKTDLAKYEFCAAMRPHVVSLGAQKNFAKFAENISKQWEENNVQFNELYFKRLIAKAIVFRFLDKSVMRQHWYGGYKANIIAYTIAKLVKMAEDVGRCLDFDIIWQEQRVSDALQKQLISIAEIVNERIQDTPDGITNVTEWCKKERCWNTIKSVSINLCNDLYHELADPNDLQCDELHAQKTQSIDNGIQAQTYVVSKGADYWQGIYSWDGFVLILTPKEKGILETACRIPDRLPSEKQSRILLEVEKKAREEGVSIVR